MANLKSKIKKSVKSVKGLSTSEILKMDVYKLNTKGLKSMLNRLVSTANKRIRRLEKNASNSPALVQYKNQKKPFTTRGLSHNELETMFKRVKNFLQAETSTMKGYKEHREDIIQNIGEFKDEQQEKDFWEIYNKWIDTHPNLAERFRDTNELQSMIFTNFVVKGKTARGTSASLTRSIKKMLGDIAEKQRKDDLLNEDVLLNNGIMQNNF